MWCWRRILKVPWTARRSNQSILKEISPECSLEGLMLKLKLQYFDHFMVAKESWLIGKDPDARKDCRQEEKGQQRMRCLYGIIDSVHMSLSKVREIEKDREAWHATVSLLVTKSWIQLSNWTTNNPFFGFQKYLLFIHNSVTQVICQPTSLAACQWTDTFKHSCLHVSLKPVWNHL